MELDARYEMGWTPLRLAAVFGKSPANVTALMQAAADVDALEEQKHGRRPTIHKASKTRAPACWRL